MKSPINIEDPIGKTVGRRVLMDPVEYGMRLHEASFHIQQDPLRRAFPQSCQWGLLC